MFAELLSSSWEAQETLKEIHFLTVLSELRCSQTCQPTTAELDRCDKCTMVESNSMAMGFGKWPSASCDPVLSGSRCQRKQNWSVFSELLQFADSPDIGKRGVKEQGRPKSPHPQPHTHLECSSAGRLPKSLLEEQRQVLDDRHFKQQKSLRRPIRITIRMGKD